MCIGDKNITWQSAKTALKFLLFFHLKQFFDHKYAVFYA